MATPLPKTNTARIVAGSPTLKTKPKKRSAYTKTAANDARQSMIAQQRSLRKNIGLMDKKQLQATRLKTFNPLTAGTNVANITAAMGSVRRLETAATTGGFILSVYWWAWGFQAAFALISFVAYQFSAEWPLVSSWFGADGFSLGFWVLASAISVVFLIAAAVTFIAEGLHLKSTWVILSFILCFGASLAPFITVIPWPAIWIGAVVWAQRK